MRYKVLILGNATDRLDQLDFIKNWKEEIWVCNYAFKEFNLPQINLVGSVHQYVAEEAVMFKKVNNLNYRILCNSFTDLKEIEPFIKYRGFSTGSELILQAINEGYKKIYLAGFCFIHDCKTDIYTKNLVVDNFQKQWEIIQEEKPKDIQIKFYPY